MKVYNDLKDKYEAAGNLPFVAIVEWTPEQRPAAINVFRKLASAREGQGVMGLHTWNLIGRNTMIVIGWTNSAVSLQKFCAAITFGTGLLMEICPAIDQFALDKALREAGAGARRGGRAGLGEKTPETQP